MSLKGLILAGGIGSRLRPITFSTPKHLIPLLGKAMIEYPLEQLIEAGIRNIGIVVGYLGNMIIDYLGNGSRYEANFTYIRQEERLGIAHAIYLSISCGYIDGPFIVYLGDNVLAKGITKYVSEFIQRDYDVYILLSRVKDPRHFGVAVIKDGKIVKLVEKPREPISDLAVVGLYMFRDPELVKKAFKTLKPSWRGEYEITELIQWFIDNGYSVGFEEVKGWWKDIGTPESLLEAIYFLLDNVETNVIRGEVMGRIVGRVIVDDGAVVEGDVYGPAYIGKNAYVGGNATIDHYSSIERNAKILSGYIMRSLVLDNTLIDIGRFRLKDSIIGRQSVISIKTNSFGEAQIITSDFSKIKI